VKSSPRWRAHLRWWWLRNARRSCLPYSGADSWN